MSPFQMSPEGLLILFHITNMSCWNATEVRLATTRTMTTDGVRSATTTDSKTRLVGAECSKRPTTTSEFAIARHNRRDFLQPYLLTYLLIHLLTCLLIYLPTHPPTYLPTYLTYLLTYIFTYLSASKETLKGIASNKGPKRNKEAGGREKERERERDRETERLRQWLAEPAEDVTSDKGLT